MEQLELFVNLPVNAPAAAASPDDLNGLFDQLNRRYWQGKLPVFRCEWSDRMITTWGVCYRRQQLIRISTLFRERPVEELEALLCHEMIHIQFSGHGPQFKAEMKRIGMKGDVQSLFPHLTPLTNSLRRPPRHTYECPACRIQIQRRRRIKGYCAACHTKGITSRFRMVRKKP